MTSIKSVQEAFHLLHSTIPNNDFSRTMAFEWWGEKNLLPSIRFFLLGYFGSVLPEVKTQLISSNTGAGRLDFCVDNIGIELAVRKPDESQNKLTSYANRTEREKLVRRTQINTHLNYGVLVLLDFANSPLSDKQLEEYRQKPPLGQGNHALDNFCLLYFYYDDTGNTTSIRKEIAF